MREFHIHVGGVNGAPEEGEEKEDGGNDSTEHAKSVQVWLSYRNNPWKEVSRDHQHPSPWRPTAVHRKMIIFAVYNWPS